MQPATLMIQDSAAEFAALLASHQRLVFKVAGTYARGKADVDDLAQEIAAQLWRSFASYDRARRFSTWMYRIALNVAISWLRSEAPRQRRSVSYDAELHEPAAFPESDDSNEGLTILRGFIAAQDPLNRALLLLYMEEHSYGEMSEILGVSETNLTTKIGRLKERLRVYAEEHHGTR